MNLSLDGAMLKIAPRPEIGDVLQLGMLKAKVVRDLAAVISVQFLDRSSEDRITDVFRKLTAGKAGTSGF